MADIPEHVAIRLDALRRALRDPDEIVRANASHALERLEAIADLDGLIERFKNGDHTERIRVIYAFGKIRSEIALKALVYALRSDDAEVRNTAVRALGDSKDARALGPLIDLLQQSQDETTQVEILAVLPLFQDERVFPAVQGALKSKNIEVVDAAIQALGRIGKREAESPLLLVLEKGPARLRRSAAVAVGDLEV